MAPTSKSPSLEDETQLLLYLVGRWWEWHCCELWFLLDHPINLWFLPLQAAPPPALENPKRCQRGYQRSRDWGRLSVRMHHKNWEALNSSKDIWNAFSMRVCKTLWLGKRFNCNNNTTKQFIFKKWNKSNVTPREHVDPFWLHRSYS